MKDSIDFWSSINHQDGLVWKDQTTLGLTQPIPKLSKIIRKSFHLKGYILIWRGRIY